MNYQEFQSSNLFNVKGKVCIVTGGGTGIGKGFAAALALNGAKVIINGRREEVIKATAQELNAAVKEAGSGGEVIAIQADVSDKEGVSEFFDKCSKIIDKLDFLVNNAGFSSNWKVQTKMDDAETLQEKLWSIDDVDFAKMTAVHVAGPYFLAVKFIPLFKKAEDPSVVNITSMAAHFLNRAVCEFSYGQSKAAEEHLTKLMSAGLMPFKIRVNAVVPGLFPSGLTTTPDGKLYGIMQDAADNDIPKGRAGYLYEIAGPVLMLASPAGDFFNGESIRIDGGWLLNSSAKDV